MITAWDDVDWVHFQVLPPDLLESPRDTIREEAWARHRERMKLLPRRLEILQEVSAANGVPLGQRGQRDCGSLEAWIRELALSRGDLLGDSGSRLTSIVHDVGALFGDELIARYPTLSWQLKRGSPRNIFYHYTVIMGFSRARSGFDLEMSFTLLSRLRQEFLGDSPRVWFSNLLETAEQWA